MGRQVTLSSVGIVRRFTLRTGVLRLDAYLMFANNDDNAEQRTKMKGLATTFCPKCGSNWAPLADYVAKPFKPGTCLRCGVPVQPTGLSLLMVAVLAIVSISSCTAFCYRPPSKTADVIEGVASWMLLVLLPVFQWVRQAWAKHQFKKDGEQTAAASPSLDRQKVDGQ
jgi:hypothetical protein